MTTPVNFKGQVALVTGAGSGLGRAYAMELARRGCNVVVNDYGGVSTGNQAGKSGGIGKAQTVVNEIIKNGGNAIANDGSVAEYKDVEKMVQQAIDTYGRLDISIVNAGVYRDRRLERLSEDDYEITMGVHVKGAFNVVKHSWPHMRKQKYGRILLTSSSSSFGGKNYWLYGTAKSAMIGMVNNLRHEGRGLGINVNALMPGAATAMSMSNPTMKESDRQKFLNANSPDFVVPAALFLCSNECQDNGECIVAEMGVFGRAALMKGPLLNSRREGPKSVEWIRNNWDQIMAIDNAPTNGWSIYDNSFKKNNGVPFGRKPSKL